MAETHGKLLFPTVTAMDVALVRWPAGADKLEVLRSQRAPRLLVIGEDSSPPRPVDELEDWVRLPVDEGEAIRIIAEAVGPRARTWEDEEAARGVRDEAVTRVLERSRIHISEPTRPY